MSVQTVTIDSLRKRLGEVDVIKMDIEGAEYNALLGMWELLQENRKVQIIMEFAPAHIKRAGHDPSELVHLLKRLSFDFFIVDENTGKLIPSSEKELLVIDELQTVNLYLKRNVA